MENTQMPSVAETEEESTDLNSDEETADSTQPAVEEPTQEDDSTQTQEELDALKAELEKERKEKENQRIRAEKAEKLAKQNKPEATIKTDGITSKDTIALINAKVHEDDVDDVVEYAKFKGISVGEALKTSVVKTMLAEKEEHRTTAAATNTGKRRAGSTRMTGEALLDKTRKTGELPDSDEDIEKLAAARFTK